MTSARGLLGVAFVLAASLPGAYAALGGTSYRPTPVADPCGARPAPTTETGAAEAVQRVVLVAADEVACSLGTSREELVLALRSPDDLEALARHRRVSRGELERNVRDGLVRAVDRANAEGLVGDGTADLVRAAAKRLPLGLLLTLLRGIDAVL